MDLEKRWIDFWFARGAHRNLAEDAYQRLEKAYTAAGRYYYNFDHIRYRLQLLDQIEIDRQNEQVELALWYNRVEHDDEELSAIFAQNDLLRLWRPAILWFAVPNIIRTKHSGNARSPNSKLRCDIDLASYGESWERFDANNKAIRQEFFRKEEGTFWQERVEFFQTLLVRSNIYYLRFFRDRYEAQARRNLTRAIAQLKA